ncbi:FHA domain-containing protein [Terrabacter sp. 2YAF2]|uniref:FHA domain-containing protein n=1 Tax=Terrabacter sp. 2YAF2 TaxID=3233026 RepID=UPI003F97FCBF
MSDPSVVVERAPDGWTHIGGPGMHLLIGLDEDDERTISASDAADGGDIDDVVEVLTAGGMRKAHHFVGVHWRPRTRIVAFGPVAAVVTLADGTEHDVRATSSKVWTDLELPEHPDRVVLRVLDESERSQPAPPLAFVTGAPAPQPVSDASAVQPAVRTPTPETLPAAGDAPPPGVIPTFGAAVRSPEAPDRTGEGASGSTGSSGSDGSGRSPWGRSWARHDTTSAASPPQADGPPPAPAAPTPEPHRSVEPTPPAVPAAGKSALRAWTSVTPPAPVRAPAPGAPTDAASAPVADDLPVVVPRDVDSTWAARPLLEPDAATSSPTPAPAPSTALPDRPAGPTAPLPDDRDDVHDGQRPALPSYDYLFGHTTTADEHRKALAQLTQTDDEDGGSDEDEPLAVSTVNDLLDVPVTNAAPVPEVPPRPIPSAPQVPPVAELSEGGLISSVPWASPAPKASQPAPEPEVPTFSGRHSPPPAPSLLPPTITPPPGVRAPEATPLIATGPPPATASPAPSPAPSPPAPPSAPSSAPLAYAPTGQPTTEPTFDVPISMPVASVPTGDVETFDDDETELTVDRSALLEARNAAQNQTISGPSVLAVLCAAGHPTTPHSDRCRVCGSSIPPQEPFTMPRPPLGVLRLSTGDVVTLDRSVLLGRAPKLGDGLAAHDRPHVVKVPSPERDVSRNHVEVILEGWHVLIRDLGTTNGTTVSLPGESPVRLRANDQQVLEPGSYVSMADEVSFTFEAAT